MDKLIVCETDRGRYVVRPMSWAGIWNEKGQIKESLNHLALFIKKEDAEKFVEWKNAEEQNRLLKLPCAVGDMTYSVNKSIRWITDAIVKKIEIDADGIWVITSSGIFSVEDFEKTVFLTKEVAKAALKELERGKGE